MFVMAVPGAAIPFVLASTNLVATYQNS